MIVCNQAANPLLIQLLCYVNVCYSFAADKIVFKSDFNEIQVIGVVLILIVSLVVIGYRYHAEKKEEAEKASLEEAEKDQKAVKA